MIKKKPLQYFAIFNENVYSGEHQWASQFYHHLDNLEAALGCYHDTVSYKIYSIDHKGKVKLLKK